MSEAWNLYKIMHSIVGNDSGMVFGPTGSGKSMFVRSVAQSAVQQDVKVAMCDTEANYIHEDIEWLKANLDYKHVTRLKNISEWIKALPQGFKLIIVDSIGGPAYGEYTRADMKQAGNIFKLIAEVAYEIQQYCQKNDAMGLLVNQPTSEFSAKEAKEQEPFGGKSGFYTKEVLKTIKLSPERGWSIIKMEVYKSRHMRSGFVLGTLGISSKSVAVKFGAYEGRKPTGWPETTCKMANPILGQEEEVDGEEPKTEDESPDIPIEEEEAKTEEETAEKSDEGEQDNPEQEDEESKLATIKIEIGEILDQKEISDGQFKAIMKGAKIELDFPDQVNDLITAGRVKVVLEGIGAKGGVEWESDIPF